ncbi:hypothetical protein EXH51_19235 [Pelomonas saccharophila]|nr:hypothetical protein [Roseateles saccharophilus]
MPYLLCDANADSAITTCRYVLSQLVVAREPWSLENGCLTPTLKIKRGRIEGGVADRVAGWYGEGRPVVWG